ncbi:hypothetical protein GCM10011571_17970 [Marinithermofilum abyssi]|uniref:Uncharacterized protein n=2 Tax=Marinithermofilum abyssi TaxID=1571185 RepID=A0A8J2VCV2_9BACL|nr:hypothetical protein GCM10011571_17970 [Marinithermofilum abyssi]
MGFWDPPFADEWMEAPPWERRDTGRQGGSSHTQQDAPIEKSRQMPSEKLPQTSPSQSKPYRDWEDLSTQMDETETIESARVRQFRSGKRKERRVTRRKK